jgi:hypothetical protein
MHAGVCTASARAAALVGVGIAAVLVGGAGCNRADSFLLVAVGGDLTLQPTQFQVTVSAGMQNKQFFVPREPASSPIALPASFSIELDRDLTGPVTVYVLAVDGGGTAIAEGQTTQTHINAGGETIVAVTIFPIIMNLIRPEAP